MATILSRKSGGTGGGGAPSGPAGGDLSGTYPNPTIGAGAVDTPELATDSVDSTIIDGADATAIRVELGVAGIDGWVDDTAATWTRTANQTFTVTGDRTAVFSKGTRLKWTQTTVKYGVVVASSHAAGTTTVTIATTTDYVLTAAAISANYYSYAASPQGYPGYFNYTPVQTGFVADPGATLAKFAVLGNTCFFVIIGGVGTSNATTFGMTLPIAAVSAMTLLCRVGDNSANLTPPGKFNVPAGSASATVQKDLANASFTASGTKYCHIQGQYEI